MSSDEWIRENVRCACNGSMKKSAHINMVALGKRAEWKYPIAGNVLIGQPCIEAVAVVCDECIEKKAKIRYAVEWGDPCWGIRYHPVEELKPLTR